ncbi:hypothetical protein GCM10009830_34260 [Glycomyces endophyticus]|uniref:Glycosyltransferase 2-like domain-containing protein n=1 Tax=Glycomyces endophyticus TaxID=480996 RepID=A0ABN2H9D8_9ACTN
MVIERLRKLAVDTVFTIGFGSDAALAAALGEPLAAAVDLEDAAPAPGASGSAALIARTATDLRRAATLAGRLPEAKRLLVAVTDLSDMHRPRTVHLPDTPAWNSLRSLDIRRGPGGLWRVESSTDRAVPLGELVAAVIAAPASPVSPVAPRIGAAGPDATAWASGPHATAVEEGEPEADAPFPASDLLLHTASRERIAVREGALATAAVGPRELPELSELDAEGLPPFDEKTVNPIGFDNNAPQGPARLAYDGVCWTAEAENAAPVRIPATGVTDAETARLRPFQSVAVDWRSHPGSIAALRAVAGLAAAGVPLTSANPSPDWAAALGGELLGRIDGAVPERLDDALRRQHHSVETRRIALREHSQQARLDRIRTAHGLPVLRPSVSALLCTRRPDFLAFAIGQIERQHHADLEIVLVLHGFSADRPEVKQAVSRTTRSVTVVEAPQSSVFGEALNQGVAAAAGDYLAKFDDDDWYSPHHVGDLLAAARYSDAELVGSLAELVYLEPLRTTIHRFGLNERRSQHVSGGTLLTSRATIRDLGGFRPLPSAIDVAFMRSLLAAQGRIYRMHGLGYVLSRRAEGHTWDLPPGEFLAQAKRQWHGVNLGEAVSAGTPPPF